jgi:hypothetical protein
MEYYGENFSKLFFGRENELNELENQILKNKMSLLIGTSGVGKTSLLYAGLINRVKNMGWKGALVRPLTEPSENLKRFLWDQLLEGELPKEFNLSDVLKAVSIANSNKNILIIIDQFEDILAAKESSDIEVLITNLLNIFNTLDENLRILICYRGDVEPHIGTIWQKISGSPQGLARTYLGPLSDKNAELVLESTIRALGIIVTESDKRKISFIKTVITDLATESFIGGHLGIYPPYLQMIIARIFEDKDKNKCYHSNQYYSAGQSKRIIADYLMNQLKYLGQKIEIGKAILIALVTSYGTKAQKTLDEISTECLFPTKDIEKALYLLIDLRLVRFVNDTYEIAHDLLAKIITSELVSAEEKEAKKFKDLLASRTAAYESTRDGLTLSEHLYIYKYCNKILCTEDEFKLLLRSYFSSHGPISYWAKRYPKPKLISFTHQLLTEQHNHSEDAAYRFLIKLGENVSLSLLSEAFSAYIEQYELSHYITRFATKSDIKLLIKLNRKKAKEIVNASQSALLRLLDLHDKVVLDSIAKSKRENTFSILEQFALHSRIKLPLREIKAGIESKTFWYKLFSIYALANKGDIDDLTRLKNLQKTELSQKIRSALIKTIIRLAIRFDKVNIIKDFLYSDDNFIIENTLEAIDTPSKIIDIKEIYKLYTSDNREYTSLASEAIYNLSTRTDIPELKKILSRISLDPSARPLVYAICKFGRGEEFSFLFKLFLNYKGRINIWNPFSVINRVSDMATKQHLPLLKKIINTDEFWSYYKEEDRPKSRIPVNDFSNIYFIKRLVATAFGKIATRKEYPIVLKMLSHDYWIVRNAALEAIKKCGNRKDIETLINIANTTTSESDSLVKAICIIDDKINKLQDVE